MTRRLVGETDVCARDDHRRCERSVGMFSDWTKRGPVYELPFGALYHPSVPNLLTAGRCLSAADDLWNVTRVIPVCAVSGEAAGEYRRAFEVYDYALDQAEELERFFGRHSCKGQSGGF